MATVLLVDNGSRRPGSTLGLRRLAAALGQRIGTKVHPVSLLHSSKVPPVELDGVPAATFEPFVRAQLMGGARELVVVPLFFGPSRALTEFIPEMLMAMRREFGPFDVRVTETLVPLPAGEPRLVQILCDNVRQAAAAQGLSTYRAVLVDHGSPIPEVTAVRQSLALGMRLVLGGEVMLEEAVMERRDGSEYDFNGPLLEERLRQLADADLSQPVILAMLFLSPGRHAGPGGDIEQICRSVQKGYPGFRIYPARLIGSHPVLVDILQSRYEQNL